MTNYVKAKIINKQKNSKCRLCDDSYKAVNHYYKQMKQIGTIGMQ